MSNKFYITTPIYYVNAQPHIGHTYTTIAADVLARYHRLLGDKTFFLTGTDEHGAKIEEKAKAANQDPRVFVDEISALFKSAWKEMNIGNDNFIRTTNTAHIKAVQKAVQFMYDQGDIYLGKYEGLYCRGCEQYLHNKDLVDGKCPDHKTVPEKMAEESYMFKLSKYQDELLERIKSDDLKIRPVERKNEVVGFYEKAGLEDVSFSRKNVKWGIPLPWDETHTIYVWADAFLNYLTGLGWDGSVPLSADMVKDFWPADIHLMSKDILRVHATIWPAMLLSLGLPLPKQLYIHGYFLTDGQKMSKSLGNVIAPEDLIKKYGADATRYLLMSATGFGSDGDISWKWFDEKYNADLANGLGNLVARVSNLIEKNNLSININSSREDLRSKFSELMQALKIDEALKIIWDEFRRADEVLTREQPWKLTDIEQIKNILEPIARDIVVSAELLSVVMPTTADKINKIFTAPAIKKGDSLFPRI